MNKKIIIGNWKMNPTSAKEARNIFSGIKKTAGTLKKTQAVVCPPAVYLLDLKGSGKAIKPALGGQDVFWEESGAYTGNISVPMIKDAGASFVILGHSEKRTQGDTNEIINIKVKSATKAGLNVVLCVGESERDSHGHYLAFLQKQLEESLDKFPVKFAGQLSVAYEPIWAIGKNATGVETPEGFHQNSLFIKKVLSKIIGKTKAMETPILYGGSVGVANAESFLKDGHADGLLVGRESLTAKNFSEILKISENTK